MNEKKIPRSSAVTLGRAERESKFLLWSYCSIARERHQVQGVVGRV